MGASVTEEDGHEWFPYSSLTLSELGKRRPAGNPPLTALIGIDAFGQIALHGAI